ncbi:MAG: AAA domain-containing protein [Xanthomonadales bacterium]|nr:CbbQ/NirQ/NorQ/GpvN family protein [Xanthomonadales bacterium]NIX12947.1 AAA domain-containing protein [Xanthomonadales bacterium]
MSIKALKPEEYFITDEPYYEPVGDEITVFEAAYQNQLPILLKGPTGCGKTRFMEHMAWRLKRPLITVSCHDDLTASDLVGRYLVTGGETVWVDGPLARAVRSGAICYLDEVVEARKDTTVVIHPLADDRRQRFVALEFDYPSPQLEAKILVNETGIDQAIAEQLIKFAQMTRNLKGSGLEEGASTRLLVHAAKLITSGVKPVVACRSCIAEALTDDPEMLTAVHELSASVF